MLNIPNINVDNLKDFLDPYTLIDLLKAGYKESISQNDYTRKLLNRNGGMSDLHFARYNALNSSFNEHIVMLEKLEKQLNKIHILHEQAQEGAGF
tara:strand:+ start:573 stop:857 length:285 start_codon:yes stop_codon:yes gene_type:complete